MGWNELGGWRIGITDKNNTYWYYAHMNSFEEGMYQGLSVTAGTVIGYVGNSGYGTVGTTGKFADHLHLQIGITMEDSRGNVWINPYEIVRFMEAYRTSIIKYIEE
jgi:murein DD-endopeptidase MepM/ murein hydrolase activator NlpD